MDNLEARPKPPSTPRTRATWLKDWITQHPTATVGEGRAALKERFGIAMGTGSIAAILKAAREATGVARRLAVPSFPGFNASSAEAVILGFVQQMRTMGFNVDLKMTGTTAGHLHVASKDGRMTHSADFDRRPRPAAPVGLGQLPLERAASLLSLALKGSRL